MEPACITAYLCSEGVILGRQTIMVDFRSAQASLKKVAAAGLVVASMGAVLVASAEPAQAFRGGLRWWRLRRWLTAMASAASVVAMAVSGAGISGWLGFRGGYGRFGTGFGYRRFGYGGFGYRRFGYGRVSATASVRRSGLGWATELPPPAMVTLWGSRWLRRLWWLRRISGWLRQRRLCRWCWRRRLRW